jgi:NAD(P)-dependent dehydrogenase (short-subunit alcohol dehydrogenase family)
MGLAYGVWPGRRLHQAGSPALLLLPGRLSVAASARSSRPAPHPPALPPCPAPCLQDAAIEKILDINVKSAVLLAKEAAPHLPRGGSIVFVSSYTAFNPAPPIAM